MRAHRQGVLTFVRPAAAALNVAYRPRYSGRMQQDLGGATQLLEQMEKELFRDTPHDVPTGPLFHYTTAQGLAGILKEKAIWATHYRYLNDRVELELAEMLITEEARRLANEYEPESEESLFLQDFADAHERDSLTNVADVYLASFSERGDLLSQWRGYGDDGRGYSVGIERFY